ncbi:hypothetical protein HGG76_20855 [Ochrobactrum tritici]|uniref:Uncharacterized protein n=1 Tax=Brucella tritici TaxID=94626 RepID=A0A7X6FTE0_9HYPH|nr:hypothetical protein [Brucella tritici]
MVTKLGRRRKSKQAKRALEPYFVHDIDPGEVAAIVLKGGASALLKKLAQIREATTSMKLTPKEARNGS